MKKKRGMRGGLTKPKGKQVAGQRYKSSLIPMAVNAKHKKQKQSKHKKTAKR